MQYRLMRLQVEGLGPVTVAIDAHGNSNYADAQTNKQTNKRTSTNRSNYDLYGWCARSSINKEKFKRLILLFIKFFKND